MSYFVEDSNNFIKLPFDGWQVDSLIGEGSYGRVYQVSHKESGLCAVKVVVFEQQDEEAFHKYEAMIEFMIGIRDCCHIVKVFEYKSVFDQDKEQYVVYARMELLHPLYDIYDYREMKEEQVVKIGIDLAEALIECEKYGVLHRDIKASNVLVDDTGVCKLADFGNMLIQDRESEEHSIKGTPTYMAPEVFHGKSYDQRADLYSVGMILYLLLNNGREPFLKPNQKVYLKKQKDEAFGRRMAGEIIPPPVEASERIAQIICRCLCYEPEKRFKNASQLKKSLERYKKKSLQISHLIAIAAIFVIVLVSVGCIFVSTNKKEAVRTDAQYEAIKDSGKVTFAFVNRNSSKYKLDTVKAICEKMGLHYEVISVPHKKYYTIVKSGEADVVMCGVNKNMELCFTDTIYYSELKLAVRKNMKNEISRKIKKEGLYEALAPYRFALGNQSKGFAYFENVEAWDYTKTTIVNNGKEAQKLVSSGQADVALINADKSIYYDNLSTISSDDLVFQIAIGCETEGDLYKEIVKALDELDQDGTLDQIAKKYQLKH